MAEEISPKIPHRAGRLEQVFLWLASATLVVLAILIIAEVVARSFFHYSFEVVDEVGGYLLVALSFFALVPSFEAKSFHTIDLVQNRLGPRARHRVQQLFVVLSLFFAVVMTATIARFVWRSYQQGDVASTNLQTPLWIPESVMIVGMLALVFVLVRTLRRGRTPR